jgi:ATP-binding cassette subfamily C (CFTR/MRP) protein 1
LLLCLFLISYCLLLTSYCLLAIILFQVGSGKSSLLSAWLGDMRLCFGQVARRGRIAYAGQRPFIQNSTLQDNIIFGLPLDHDRYRRTLWECALEPDLAVLPAGDQTEIGERGINLSGGQKARVALARAVYSDADVYLLDDPLAAVDAHVGQHLYEECVSRLVGRGKCVVLVTNALQVGGCKEYAIVVRCFFTLASYYDQPHITYYM